MKIKTQIVMLLVSLFIAPSMSSATDNNSGWSYSIRDGIAKSKRSYLLVYRPGTKEEKQINVVSSCSKTFYSEGVYGKCNHDILIKPENKKISLDTGEDVIIPDSNFDFLILGTIDYGCCSVSDTVKFYTESGDYLGRLNGINISKGRDTITNTIDLRNSRRGRDESINFFVVQDEKDDLRYSAWVKENKSTMRKLPIIFSMPNKEACEEWYLTDFIRYYDRKDITFTLEGRFCEKQERTFSCQKEEDKINCTPTQ